MEQSGVALHPLGGELPPSVVQLKGGLQNAQPQGQALAGHHTGLGCPAEASAGGAPGEGQEQELPSAFGGAAGLRPAAKSNSPLPAADPKLGVMGAPAWAGDQGKAPPEVTNNVPPPAPAPAPACAPIPAPGHPQAKVPGASGAKGAPRMVQASFSFTKPQRLPTPSAAPAAPPPAAATAMAPVCTGGTPARLLPPLLPPGSSPGPLAAPAPHPAPCEPSGLTPPPQLHGVPAPQSAAGTTPPGSAVAPAVAAPGVGGEGPPLRAAGILTPLDVAGTALGRLLSARPAKTAAAAAKGGGGRLQPPGGTAISPHATDFPGGAVEPGQMKRVRASLAAAKKQPPGKTPLPLEAVVLLLSAPVPEAGPAPAPAAMPEAGTSPAPAAMPEAGPAFASTPMPEAGPAPAPAPTPGAGPAPAPTEAAPTPAPQDVLALAPAPAPQAALPLARDDLPTSGLAGAVDDSRAGAAEASGQERVQELRSELDTSVAYPLAGTNAAGLGQRVAAGVVGDGEAGTPVAEAAAPSSRRTRRRTKEAASAPAPAGPPCEQAGSAAAVGPQPAAAAAGSGKRTGRAGAAPRAKGDGPKAPRSRAGARAGAGAGAGHDADVGSGCEVVLCPDHDAGPIDLTLAPPSDPRDCKEKARKQVCIPPGQGSE